MKFELFLSLEITDTDRTHRNIVCAAEEIYVLTHQTTLKKNKQTTKAPYSPATTAFSDLLETIGITMRTGLLNQTLLCRLSGCDTARLGRYFVDGLLFPAYSLSYFLGNYSPEPCHNNMTWKDDNPPQPRLCPPLTGGIFSKA